MTYGKDELWRKMPRCTISTDNCSRIGQLIVMKLKIKKMNDMRKRTETAPRFSMKKT